MLFYFMDVFSFGFSTMSILMFQYFKLSYYVEIYKEYSVQKNILFITWSFIPWSFDTLFIAKPNSSRCIIEQSRRYSHLEYKCTFWRFAGSLTAVENATILLLLSKETEPTLNKRCVCSCSNKTLFCESDMCISLGITLN